MDIHPVVCVTFINFRPRIFQFRFAHYDEKTVLNNCLYLIYK